MSEWCVHAIADIRCLDGAHVSLGRDTSWSLFSPVPLGSLCPNRLSYSSGMGTQTFLVVHRIPEPLGTNVLITAAPLRSVDAHRFLVRTRRARDAATRLQPATTRGGGVGGVSNEGNGASRACSIAPPSVQRMVVRAQLSPYAEYVPIYRDAYSACRFVQHMTTPEGNLTVHREFCM